MSRRFQRSHTPIHRKAECGFKRCAGLSRTSRHGGGANIETFEGVMNMQKLSNPYRMHIAIAKDGRNHLSPFNSRTDVETM